MFQICKRNNIEIDHWPNEHNLTKLDEIFYSLMFITVAKDKLKLTGWALGRVFNFRSGCMPTMHLLPSVAIQPNLELKTWAKQLLGSLPLVIALPAVVFVYNYWILYKIVISRYFLKNIVYFCWSTCTFSLKICSKLVMGRIRLKRAFWA